MCFIPVLMFLFCCLQALPAAPHAQLENIQDQQEMKKSLCMAIQRRILIKLKLRMVVGAFVQFLDIQAVSCRWVINHCLC